MWVCYHDKAKSLDRNDLKLGIVVVSTAGPALVGGPGVRTRKPQLERLTRFVQIRRVFRVGQEDERRQFTG